MMNLPPDLMDALVREHIDGLRPTGREDRRRPAAGTVRRAIGTSLIRLGEWVAGQRLQAPAHPVTGSLATR
jgi:hypothetical protein